MLQDTQTSIDNHKRFIKRVVETKIVWGLKSEKGWIVSESNEYENRDVMPFWSDRAYAARAAKDEWAEYEPTSIDLDSFIDNWLKGMHEDDVLVGTNWDAHLCGLEIEAIDLAKELIDVLEKA